jgi:3-deoxy-manno-octulosonate cytidylyltransferase (CMP-KDO synthetase)
MKSPAVLGIIPARYASTRFPGKPLIHLLGKSLIQRTYENTLLCKALDEVVVATDDQRIYDHVREFGGNVVMTSMDCPTGTDRLADVLKREERYNNTRIVVNIQGDEPCINPAVIEKAVSCLIHDEKAVMATAVVPMVSGAGTDVNTVKCVMDLNGYALYFSRSLIPGGRSGTPQAETTYYKHVGLYVFKRDFVLTYASLPPTPLQLAEDLEQLKVLENGYSIKVAVVDYVSLEVNVPEDIQKVEKELCRQNTFL